MSLLARRMGRSPSTATLSLDQFIGEGHRAGLAPRDVLRQHPPPARKARPQRPRVSRTTGRRLLGVTDSAEQSAPASRGPPAVAAAAAHIRPAEMEAKNNCASAVTEDGSLLDNLTLELRVHPPSIEIDNHAHDKWTVVTIDSANRPGSLIYVRAACQPARWLPLGPAGGAAAARQPRPAAAGLGGMPLFTTAGSMP